MKTYQPMALPIDDSKLDADIEAIIEKIAVAVHERWAQSRLEEGWIYGQERNDELKEHPCLVPYEQLTEIEKNYDRNTARTTIKLLQHFGYEVKKRK